MVGGKQTNYSEILKNTIAHKMEIGPRDRYIRVRHDGRHTNDIADDIIDEILIILLMIWEIKQIVINCIHERKWPYS